MYETSKTKLVRDKRKPQLLPHQPQQLKFQSLTTRSKTTIFEGGEEEEDEETGDVVSGDENDDDLGWEYQVGWLGWTGGPSQFDHYSQYISFPSLNLEKSGLSIR